MTGLGHDSFLQNIFQDTIHQYFYYGSRINDSALNEIQEIFKYLYTTRQVMKNIFTD